MKYTIFQLNLNSHTLRSVLNINPQFQLNLKIYNKN